MRGRIFLALTFIIIAILCFAVYQKEDIIKNGDEFYISLEPVDPRSILQGDYMILHYNYNSGKSMSWDTDDSDDMDYKYAILYLSSNGVVSGYTLTNDEVAADNQVLLKVQQQKPLKFVANTFFFQKGKAELFDDAKFARFKYKKGESILISLHDKSFREIKSEKF